MRNQSLEKSTRLKDNNGINVSRKGTPRSWTRKKGGGYMIREAILLLVLYVLLGNMIVTKKKKPRMYNNFLKKGRSIFDEFFVFSS